MKDTTHQQKMCNADRNQRKTCVYFHEKTGRCSRPADESTWPGRASSSVADRKT